MARAKEQHSIDIPEYLWAALDRAAEFHNVPTNRMIAEWLWRHARRHVDDRDLTHLAPELARELLALPRPYDRDVGGTRDYPRRLPDDPRQAPSHLAAQIVAEGSPSPTLAAIQAAAAKEPWSFRDSQIAGEQPLAGEWEQEAAAAGAGELPGQTSIFDSEE